ncbi:hypothetical protein chiPu_0025174, partial [Chiloscyllium punctatum]|nr:hypothetical protein [Chiloscyllium punctatum]
MGPRVLAARLPGSAVRELLWSRRDPVPLGKLLSRSGPGLGPGPVLHQRSPGRRIAAIAAAPYSSSAVDMRSYLWAMYKETKKVSE